MKKIVKFLGFLLLAFIVFFFWASSSSLSESEYATITEVTSFNTPKNDSIFSIATYNIGYLSGMTNNRAIEKPKSLFDNNLKKVLSETQKINPDIFAFQEIDYNASRSYQVDQEAEIANLGYNYRARTINWDERYLPFPYWPISMHFGKVISGQSVLSKYPLKEQKRIVLERVADAPFFRDAFYLERLAQIVKVTLQGREVVVINVHLEAFDQKTRENQFLEVLRIFDRYKNEYPTILLGDFNSEARSNSAIIQKMFAQKEVGNAAFLKQNPSNTFNSRNPYKRIDYIFYSKNSIEYVSGKVLNEFGEASDHLPVYMEFKLK